MKPLNVAFHSSQKEFIASLSDDISVTRSELCRAAMVIGLDTIAQLAAQDKKEAARYVAVNDALSKKER